MRRTLIATLALGSILAGAHAAAAQSIPSPYRYIESKHSAGFFAGYLLTDPTIAIDTFQVELGPRSGPLFGARYGIALGGPLTGEASVAFSPTHRTVNAPSAQVGNPAPVPRAVESVALLMLEGGLHFRLTGSRTWNGLAPFLNGTGGIVADLRRGAESEEEIPENARFDFGPSFAVGAAVGTEWFPTRRLSLRAEVRDRLWQIGAPEGLRPGRTDVSEWTHNVAFTLGGALHF